VDLNRFKLINDTLGHQYGNSLLIEVGKRLKATLREEDIVAHLNGDEFAVMLTDIAEEYHASVVANKILEALFVPIADRRISIAGRCQYRYQYCACRWRAC
jgi:diguanylate cyclase (GGDEF)-like protein